MKHKISGSVLVVLLLLAAVATGRAIEEVRPAVTEHVIKGPRHFVADRWPIPVDLGLYQHPV